MKKRFRLYSSPDRFMRCITAFLLCFSANVLAEPKSTRFEDRDIKIAFTSNSASSESSINIEAGGISRSSVFSIPTPPRIVIDLFGPKVSKNSEVKISNDTVSRLRIGAHSDKTRIVIDIKSAEVPPYNWSESKKGAVLKINFKPSNEDGLLDEVIAAEPTPKATQSTSSSSPTPTLKASPSPTETATKPTTVPSKATATLPIAKDETIEEILALTPHEIETPTTPPTVAPTSTVQVPSTPSPQTAVQASVAPGEFKAKASPTPLAPTPSASRATTPEPANPQEVASLEFGRSGEKPDPTIKLKLGSKSEFELQKIDEKSYKLTIPRLKLLRPALKLPQFPPHDFSGFNMVLLQEVNDGIEATISVDSGVRLSAAPNGEEIWIKIASEATQLTQSPPGIHPHPKSKK